MEIISVLVCLFCVASLSPRLEMENDRFNVNKQKCIVSKKKKKKKKGQQTLLTHIKETNNP